MILFESTFKGQALSTQHIYRSTTANGYNRTYMTKQGVAMKESYQWEAKSKCKVPVECEIEMSLRFFHGDRRKRDIDNYNKLVLDALSGIVYLDDNQISKLTIERFYDKESPRVEICILTR